MARPADYRFVFEYKDPWIEAKPVLYEIWVTPNQKQVELVKGDFNYVKFSEDNSSIFFQIFHY